MELDDFEKILLRDIVQILRRNKYTLTADFLQELIIKLKQDDK